MAFEGIITNIIVLCSLALIKQKIDEVSIDTDDEIWKNVKMDIHLYIHSMNKDMVSPILVQVRNINSTNTLTKNVDRNDTEIYSALNKYEKQNITYYKEIWDYKNMSPVKIEMTIFIKNDLEDGCKKSSTGFTFSKENFVNKEDIYFNRYIDKNCKSRVFITFYLNKILKEHFPLINSSLISSTSLKSNTNQDLAYRQTTPYKPYAIISWILEHWHFIISFAPVSIVFLYKKCKTFPTFLRWLLTRVEYYRKILWNYKDIMTEHKNVFIFKNDMNRSYGNICSLCGRCFKKVGIKKVKLALNIFNAEYRCDKKLILYYSKKSITFDKHMRQNLRNYNKSQKEPKKGEIKRLSAKQCFQQMGGGEITEENSQIHRHTQYFCNTNKLCLNKLNLTTKIKDKQNKFINIYKKQKHIIPKKIKSLNNVKDKLTTADETKSVTALELQNDLKKYNSSVNRIEKQLTFDNLSLQTNPLFQKQKSQHLENSTVHL